MRLLLNKEGRLSASVLSYFFIAFGVMFFLPGYPILCGVFFVTLGLYQSFQNAREANDIVFSVLLPVSRRDVVKGKFLFAVCIELAGFLLMCLATGLRMTVLSEALPYRNNALMNANPFALGYALMLFGVFNRIFIGGYFKTVYKLGKPFIAYGITVFLLIGAAEALHHFPGAEAVNAFGTDHLGLQLLLLAAGAFLGTGLTLLAYRKACASFEAIDL